MNVELLKALLSTPSHYTDESRMIRALMEHFKERGWKHYMDRVGNVYVTKGSSNGRYCPLICAHTDTVHALQGRITIYEQDGCLHGWNTFHNEPTGCGGDDKAGIFVCLELLDMLDNVKAVFFATEEIGCKGAEVADSEFFQDVGFAVEFDSPHNDIMSFSCNGIQLFDPDGMFARSAIPILDSYGVTKWQNHPYTDVAVLRRRFKLECLNLPCGYYDMHTVHEYVVLADVEKAIQFGSQVIGAIPHQQYLLDSKFRSEPADRHVTGLILEKSKR